VYEHDPSPEDILRRNLQKVQTPVVERLEVEAAAAAVGVKEEAMAGAEQDERKSQSMRTKEMESLRMCICIRTQCRGLVEEQEEMVAVSPCVRVCRCHPRNRKRPIRRQSLV
jgi:CO dehydrogenase/acetyl-CoA synthase beta subunit